MSLDRCTVSIMVEQDGAYAWVRCGCASRRFFYSDGLQRVEAACYAHCQNKLDFYQQGYVEVSRTEAEAYRVHLS